jgi:hypothetical protein
MTMRFAGWQVFGNAMIDSLEDFLEPGIAPERVKCWVGSKPCEPNTRTARVERPLQALQSFLVLSDPHIESRTSTFATW